MSTKYTLEYIEKRINPQQGGNKTTAETKSKGKYTSEYINNYITQKNAEKQKLENPKAYTVAPTTQPVQSPKAEMNNQVFTQQNPARLQLNGVIQDAKKNMLNGNALSAPLSASPFKFEDVKPNPMPAATNFNDIPQLPIKKQMDANLKAIKDIGGIEKYDKYTNRNYAEGKRFAPNYDAGRLSQDEAKAWNTYLNDQTQVNKLKAQNISNVKNTFIQNNADAVGKGNLFSKDLAGYLPQLLDQTAASGKGGVLAGGAALALGALGPQVGLPEEIITVPTAIKAGITAGSAKYSYEQMRGASYKNLIDLGVSEETATSMSNDDALIEAAIEAVDTGIDIATLGIGKVINLLGKAGVKSTAKLLAKKGAEKAAESTLQKIGKLAAKYGINVASEGLQESAQEVVGIETEKRALSKDGLVRSATSAEDRQRILESGIGGARLAALLAAPTLITNTAITSTVGKNKPPQSVANDTAMPTTTAAEPAPVAAPPERTYPLALPAKGYTTKPPLYVSPNGDISNKVDKPSIPTRRIVEQFNDIDTPDIIPQSSGGYYQVDDVPLINATLKIANNKGVAPSEVIAEVIKPIRADIDDAIAGLTEELQAYTGLGVGFMAKENDYGAPTYIRFSNNEQWYRDFYKENKRAPNKGERAGIAEQMVMRDVEKAGGQYLDEKAEQRYNVFNNLLPQLEIVGDNALEVFNGYDGTEVIRGRNRVETIPNYNAKWTRQRLVGEQKATLESAQRAGVQDHTKINKVMDLSRRLGVPVRFVDTISDNINGKYENGVIYISNKSKTPIKNVFVHELTHFIEASGKYNDLANAIMDSDVFYNTLNEKGLTLDEYRQSIKETYAANGIELDKDGINREIVATFAENYLKDEKMISRLAETDTGLFTRIQNWVKDLLVRFRGTAEEKSLLEISKLYGKAFKDAKGKTAASGAKMHISQNAGQEIDRALSDKGYRQEVKLRDFTPQILIDHGVQNLPMLMNVSHLRENIWTKEEARANGYQIKPRQNWHGLGKDLFMRVIDSLDNPIAVYRGTETASDTSRRSNYFLIITALTDAKDGTASGNKINVPIYVEQKAFYNDVVIDANKIATVFGRTNINEYINKMLASGELVRVKRKSEVASGWDQSPASSNNTFSNPTISQPTSGVNTHYMQNNKKDAQHSISGADATIDELNKKYGTIKPGEKPVRDVNLPKRTAKDQYVSKYARTMAEAGVTNEPAVDLIKKDIAAGRLSHEVITDKKAMESAENIIREDGFEGALKTWTDVIDGKVKPTKYTLALGQTLYNEAVQNKDAALVKKMIADMVLEFSTAGQNLQAARLLKKLTPDGRLYSLEKSVVKINKELSEKFSNKIPDIEIPVELAQNLLDAKDTRQTDIAVEAIQQYVADCVPATWQDKLNAWRYLSMLGNSRTHIKNILGNMVFVPVRQLKNIMGIVPERILLPQEQRTKSILNPIAKEDKRLKAFAENDFDMFEKEIKGESKYDIGSGIQDKRKIFKTKLLENARAFNFKALEAEDMFFLKGAYVSSFSQAMKARGLTPPQIYAGTDRSNIQLESIRQYATLEAQKATYRDACALASFISRGKRKLENAASSTKNPMSKIGLGAASMVAEGIMPFNKTPINILRRGMEYSPFGLLSGTMNALISVKNGEMTAGHVIDQFASALSGTAIMAFGAWLAISGLITGGKEEKKKEEEFEDLQGQQNYALNIGGISYTIDWTAPAALPLFVGVEIANSLSDKKMTFSDILNSFSKITNPVFELSMLQGITGAFKSATYSEYTELVAAGIDAMYNYAGQYVPSVFGAVARTVDDTRRTYYIDKNSEVPVGAQKFTQRQQAKIPFASKNLPPRLDQWGRKDVEPNVAMRIFENFLSPGYVSKHNTTIVDKEIDRLYKKTGLTEVLPGYAQSSFKVDGETKYLTAQEFAEYAEIKGQTAFEEIKALISTERYKQLPDSDKAKRITDLYVYSNAAAKYKALGIEPQGADKKKFDAQKLGISPEAYKEIQDIEGDKGVGGSTLPLSASRKKRAAIDKAAAGASRAEKVKLYEMFGVSKQVW